MLMMGILNRKITDKIVTAILVVLMFVPCSIKRELKQVLDLPIHTEANVLKNNSALTCNALQRKQENYITQANAARKLLYGPPFYSEPARSVAITFAVTLPVSPRKRSACNISIPLYLGNRSLLI